MNRRSQVSALVAGFVIVVLLTLAASSGSYRIWVTPSSDVGRPSQSEEQVGEVVPAKPVPNDQVELPGWIGGLLGVLSAVVIALGLAAAVTFGVVGRLPRPGLRGRRAWIRREASALPEVEEPTLSLDVASARAALVGGTPRNSIVACWMQLERDAATAGVRRLAAETPAEYVQRVIATASVDAAPIIELAALYREARFSIHPLDDDHRARALAALDRVAAELGSAVEVPV